MKMKKGVISIVLVLVCIVSFGQENNFLSADKAASNTPQRCVAQQQNQEIRDFYTITKGAVKAFAWNAYCPTSVISDGPVSFFTNDTAVSSILASPIVVYTGTWMDSIWVVLDYATNDLLKVDTATGVLSTITSISGFPSEPTAIEYDYTTNTLYALVYDNINTYLYSVDVSLGTATIIGGHYGLGITLACDQIGNLYTIDILGDSCCMINKSTGAWTGIGNIGFDASYAQDMTYDHINQICYMAAYNNSLSRGELRTIDLTTGMSTLIGPFTGDCELVALAIPYDNLVTSVEEGQEQKIQLYPNPSSGIFTLSMENEGNVYIYDLLGKEVYTAKVFSSTQIDLSNLTEANYIMRVVTEEGTMVKQISIIK